MAVTFVGVAANAICAPLNPAYSRREFEFYLSDLKPKALIVQSGMNSAAVAVAEERAIAIIELSSKPGAADGVLDLGDNQQRAPSTFSLPQANDIALILHTSGTTSRPKMVPLTHANLIASAGNIAATLRLSEADRCLNVMPLFHIHGLVGALLSSVMAGASVVCASGFDERAVLLMARGFSSDLVHGGADDSSRCCRLRASGADGVQQSLAQIHPIFVCRATCTGDAGLRGIVPGSCD